MGRKPTKGTFSLDDIMELRISAIQYKINQKISSNTQMVKIAALKCKGVDLSRFLSGNTNDFGDREGLRTFLESKGYWPSEKASSMLYSAFSAFSSSSQVSSSSSLLRSISGEYEYYQWSSTSPGEVTISKVSISSPDDSEANYASVTEEQMNSEKTRSEIYEGCCFCTNNGVVFITRETQHRRVKFIICDVFNQDRMYGLTLKESSVKSLHLSNVYFRAITAGNIIEPRFEFFDRLADPIKSKLQEPLTSFNLTWKDKKYVEARKKIIALMDELVVKSGDENEK